ncbi:MAG TPA: acyl-CoA thioesterase [Candidatus Acidoferrum sp.]|jgi:acyl-CoA hydrolase
MIAAIATLQGRPVRESLSEYTQVTLPNDANVLGNVLGGHIMHLVDLCGGLAAWRHARGPVVTASVDHMSFLHPVRVGQLLLLKSSVNRVFNSSMEVGVKVWVEDANTGEVHHTSSAYLTFVAIDQSGKPGAVAPVLPENEEEKRRYEEAGRRRERRVSARQSFCDQK